MIVDRDSRSQVKKRTIDKVYVRKLRLNQAGYERHTGVYFGVGMPIYEYEFFNIIKGHWQTDYLRARDREEAKERITSILIGKWGYDDVNFWR